MLSDEEIQIFVNRPRDPSWFIRHYVDLHDACLKLMYHGVRYDLEGAKIKYAEFMTKKDSLKNEILALTRGVKLWSEKIHRSDELVALYEAQKALKASYDAIAKTDKAGRKAFKPQLVEIADQIRVCRESGRGQSVEVGSGLSDDKIIEWFVGQGVKIPSKRRQGGKVTETVDDIALKRIAQRYPKQTPLVLLIQQHRKCNTLLKYVDENKIDKDGRIRCQYKPAATQNARLSSAENPLGTGTNLQNFDRSLKELLLPDQDKAA